MPFKYAPHWTAFVVLVTFAGFWPSYFAPIMHVPFAFHFHAFTAMTWLLLIITQSIAIQRRQTALHKIMGKASFALFPLVIVGFVMILNNMAQRYASAPTEEDLVVGPGFSFMTMIAIAAFLTLFYLSLKHRRNVRLHAGYLLATPMMLFESAFGRLQDRAFPWMNVIDSEGPHTLMDSIPINNTMAMAVALVLYFMDRKNGAPWLVVSGFLTAHSLMWFAPYFDFPAIVLQAYASVPQAAWLVTGLLAGIAITYLGWQGGKPPEKAVLKNAQA